MDAEVMHNDAPNKAPTHKAFAGQTAMQPRKPNKHSISLASIMTGCLTGQPR